MTECLSCRLKWRLNWHNLVLLAVVGTVPRSGGDCVGVGSAILVP